MVERLTLRPASYGELLKSEFAPERHRRDKRERDEAYLASIRQLPCLACGAAPPTQAAHVRMTDGRRGKRIVGIGIKPGDPWCIPLCPQCHDEQHRLGERLFWSEAGKDPVRISLRLHKSKHSVEIMREIVRLEREKIEAETE